MTTQTELIRGKVAKILNTREVALNIGSEHGVEPGMFFDILSPAGLSIEDPDTGEYLGSVELPKAQVRIDRVYDKMSVASTYRTKRVNVGGGIESEVQSLTRKLFQPPKWETRYETLKTRESFEKDVEDLDERDSYVASGDPVVQVRAGNRKPS